MRLENKIVVACSPKSGSTFLTRFLSNYFDIPIVNLVPAHGMRQQEIDVGCIPKDGGFVSQNHIWWSEFTEKVAEQHDLKIVVLTRNLYDSLVSLREHFISESIIGPLVSIGDNFSSLSVEDQLSLVSQAAGPWYLSFYSSWVRKNYPINFYENIYSKDDLASRKSILELLNYIAPHEDHGAKRIAAAIKATNSGFNRMNVGKSGRGVIISDVHRSQLENLSRLIDPFVDFRKIGLFLREVGFLKKLSVSMSLNF